MSDLTYRHIQFCCKCGFELEENEVFCPSCGQRLIAEEQEPETHNLPVSSDSTSVAAANTHRQLSSTARFFIGVGAIAVFIAIILIVNYANSDEGKLRAAIRLAHSFNFEKARSRIDGVPGEDAQALRSYFNLQLMIENSQQPSQYSDETDNVVEDLLFSVEEQLNMIPENYLLRKAEFSDEILQLKTIIEKIHTLDSDIESAIGNLSNILNMYETLKRHKAGGSFTIRGMLDELGGYQQSLYGAKNTLKQYPDIKFTSDSIILDLQADIEFYMSNYASNPEGFDATESIYFTKVGAAWESHSHTYHTQTSIRESFRVPVNQYKWELLKQWLR